MKKYSEEINEIPVNSKAFNSRRSQSTGEKSDCLEHVWKQKKVRK